MDARARKQALREAMIARRRASDPESLALAGSAVAARVRDLPELARPTSVLVYVSVRRELPTGELIRALLEAGHDVAVPRVVGTELEARRWAEPLVDGVLRIPTSDGPLVEPIAAAVVPGLAFDAGGGRLGYGGGYYDRWLAGRDVRTIGICSDEALIAAVPLEDHDRRVELVVTPSRTLRVRRPVRVTAGAWVRDGRVLAVRRPAGRARGGLWELPGGKVEAGESDAESLVRELREELGADVRVTGALCDAVHAYDDVTVHLVGLRVEGDGVPVLHEHDAERWLAPEELDDVTWAPADLPLIESLKLCLR